MDLRVSALLSAFLITASAHAQIAFVRDHTLYVLACDKTGKPAAGAKPARICPVPVESSGDDKRVDWTPDGRIVFSPREEPHVHPGSIDIVDARPGAKPRVLVRGFSPSFFPDGTKMAYSTATEEWGSSKISILDLRTGKSVTFAEHATEPDWSPSGDRIAYAIEGGDFSQEVYVRDYPSGKTARKFPPAVNPGWISFSPDESILAVQYHLSRPKTGHTLFDLRNGNTVDLPYPNKYAPPTIEDWSPDGKAVLCDWRVIDPNNNGTWTQQFEAITWLKTGKSQLLAEGRDAQFAPDGEHVLYVSKPTRTTGDLYWQPIRAKASSRVRLAAGITQFAVRRPRSRS